MFIAIMVLAQSGISLGTHGVMKTLKLMAIGAACLFATLATAGATSLLVAEILPWFEPILMSIATGGLFPLAWLQPLNFACDKHEITRLSGLTQSGGYLVGGALPSLSGVFVDQAGSMSAE